MTETPTTRKSYTVEDWSTKVWAEGKIGFHKDIVHPLLEKHVDKLTGGRSDIKIFVPLCGKTLDITWLADKGHTVVGVESTQQAVDEFFKENNLEFTVENIDSIKGELYTAKDKKIRLYHCDLFQFSSSVEKSFDAIWDRGSIVAINVSDREKYAALMISLMAPKCRQLVVTHIYDPDEMQDPPHYFLEGDFCFLYGRDYKYERLDERDIMVEEAEKQKWMDRGLSSHHEILYLMKNNEPVIRT